MRAKDTATEAAARRPGASPPPEPELTDALLTDAAGTDAASSEEAPSDAVRFGAATRAGGGGRSFPAVRGRGGRGRAGSGCAEPLEGGPDQPGRANPAPGPAEGRALLAWYDRHRRALPWRAEPGEVADPYRVWLSEVMLQQTTVAAVRAYYETFLRRWPTVADLAAAPDDAVMAAWAGLGYYARARNLLACARVVAATGFPTTRAGLRALPGVGDYTSAAIAAIAFGEAVPVVDGNVERVVARLTRLPQPPKAVKGRVEASVAAMVPADRPGDFAQAMMDLGATICTPKSPVCALCPLRDGCGAAAAGDPLSFPVKAPKKARAVWHGVAFVPVRPGGLVLLRRRPSKGLLGGMAEVFGTPWAVPPDPLVAAPAAPASQGPTSGAGGELGDGAAPWPAAGPRDRGERVAPSRSAAGGGADHGPSQAALAHAPFAADWVHAGHIVHGFTHAELTIDVYRARVTGAAATPDGAWWGHPDTAGLPTLMAKVVARALGMSD